MPIRFPIPGLNSISNQYRKWLKRGNYPKSRLSRYDLIFLVADMRNAPPAAPPQNVDVTFWELVFNLAESIENDMPACAIAPRVEMR